MKLLPWSWRTANPRATSKHPPSGTPVYEIGTLLGYSQFSTTTRSAHHAPQRLVETAVTAGRAGNSGGRAKPLRAAGRGRS